MASIDEYPQVKAQLAPELHVMPRTRHITATGIPSAASSRTSG